MGEQQPRADRRDIDKEIRDAIAAAEVRFTQVVREVGTDIRLEIDDHRKAEYPHPSSAPAEQGRQLWDERNERRGSDRSTRFTIYLVGAVLGAGEALAIILQTAHK